MTTSYMFEFEGLCLDPPEKRRWYLKRMLVIIIFRVIGKEAPWTSILAVAKMQIILTSGSKFYCQELVIILPFWYE